MLYLDVHGTLFEYDYSIYNQTPAWFEEGSHPFAEDKPLGYMPEIIGKLKELGVELCTLCRINKGTELAQSEQREDVKNNLCMHYPMIELANHNYCTGDKSLFVGRPLSRRDILLEDYQPNCIEWERAGGTSVKVLNGVNSLKTWHGLFIDPRKDPDAAVRYLYDIYSEYNRRFK